MVTSYNLPSLSSDACEELFQRKSTQVGSQVVSCDLLPIITTVNKPQVGKRSFGPQNYLFYVYIVTILMPLRATKEAAKFLFCL